jgi:hypothetical protein
MNTACMRILLVANYEEFFIVSDTFSLHPNNGLIFVLSSYQVTSLITANYNGIDATEGYSLTDFSWHFRHIIL